MNERNRTMNYDEFRRFVEAILPQCLPDKYAGTKIEAVSEHVTNGEDKEGFSLGRITDKDTGISFSPVYYYSDLYREFRLQNMDADQIGGWLKDQAAGWFASGEQAVRRYVGLCSDLDPGRIYYSLMNTDANRYYLAEIPHREMLDFSVIYHYYFEMTEDGVANAVITNKTAERLGMTEPELYRTACTNMPKLFPAKMEWLSEKLGYRHDMENNGDILYISTSAMMYGPCTMFYPGILDEISAKLGGDVYTIPVSIHELLAVRAHGLLKESLTLAAVKPDGMGVSPDERLSNETYYYNVKEQTLSFATEKSAPPLTRAKDGRPSIEKDTTVTVSQTVRSAPRK